MGGKHGTGKRATREEVYKIALKVSDWLETDVEVGGSYARGEEECGDIDLLVMGDVEDYKQKLIDKWGRCSNGKPRRSGVIDGMQIDIMFATADFYGASRLAIRGNGEFNMGMRSTAKKQGYLLNQYGLWNREKTVRHAGTTEEEIFEKLGMEYVKPEHRTGIKIVQKARKGTYKEWALDEIAVDESWWE